MATNQFCTFFLDGMFLGVEVLKVQEVLRYQEMTQVPLAPPVVSGLINLRGQIVTAIDLRRRLQLRERHPEQLPMNIVINSDDGAISLLVDEIGDVLEVSDDGLEQPPATLDPATRDLLESVCKLNDKLLLILNTEKAVNL